jgi:thiol-disulfide isomerase/thioredoxin
MRHMTELMVGDDAPPLKLGAFLKGEPFSQFEPGRIYVLEFWSSWCGPCRQSLPHLSDLRRKFPEARLLGVNVFERQPEDAKAFVREHADAIAYAIAVDAPDPDDANNLRGWMTRHWLEPAFQSGVPVAFIVDGDGKIGWIGHPMELEEKLAAHVEGRWDLERAAKAHRATLRERHLADRFRLFQALNQFPEKDQAGERLRLIEDAFLETPALEGDLGFLKLMTLKERAESKPQALAYATRMMGFETEDDLGRVLGFSAILLQGPDRAAGPLSITQDPDYARLAVDALRRVEAELDKATSPELMAPETKLHLDFELAKGLLALGDAHGALERAWRARHGAVTVGVPPEALAQFDALIDACESHVRDG